ncbi:MAG: hypothetical protein EOO08_04505 [Chitinophagaceae bacterium]|nr:MAG: hypothetical protein EOO08_04505 [Chitinophagaceae bacterium]
MIGFFHEYRNSQKVVAREYNFIFYSEGAHYHQYLGHLWDALVELKKYSLCYITSDAKDPVLSQQRDGIDVFCLRSTLMFVFPRLRAKAMVLTMPNLGLHGYKRSPKVGKYVYVFHALVSSHQQYHEQAFDHYDALFCCGPYHEAEARKAESLRGFAPRTLVPYGYPLLGAIAQGPVLAGEKCVLVAPSWHPEGILSTCIEPLLEQLLTLALPVLIRPHPEFRKREPKKMASLEAMIRRNAQLRLDTAPDVLTTLASAELLVTDRSGIALEYAFGRKRPVLFIDTPPKVYNKNFGLVGLEPVEDRLRPQLGVCVSAQKLTEVPSAARFLLTNAEDWREKMAALEAATIYSLDQRVNGIAYLTGLSS